MSREQGGEAGGGAARALAHLGPGAAYVVLLFVKGTERASGTPLHLSDKLLHAVGFGVVVPFALLALRYFERPVRLAARLSVSVLVASLLGALLELWQAFLPYRSSELLDWVADTVGAVLVAGVVLALAAVSRKGVSRADA
jgi:VanZ family protein